MRRRPEERMSLRMVDASSVMVESSYEVPKWELLMIVVCHDCVCRCLCSKVDSSCEKMKEYEEGKTRERGRGQEIYSQQASMKRVNNLQGSRSQYAKGNSDNRDYAAAVNRTFPNRLERKKERHQTMFGG